MAYRYKAVLSLSELLENAADLTERARGLESGFMESLSEDMYWQKEEGDSDSYVIDTENSLEFARFGNTPSYVPADSW